MDLFDKIQKENYIDLLANFYDPYDNRGSLRTHYLAHSFIKLAFKYPNHKIFISDHYTLDNYRRNVEYMRLRLSDIFNINNMHYMNMGKDHSNDGRLYIEFIPSSPEHINNIEKLWELISENFYKTIN